jgi:hypothetical protein
MLKAAQSAEDDLIATQRIAREAVGLSQGFLANSQGGGGLKSPTIGAYPSQAEDTMRRYAPGGGQSTDGSASTPGGDRRSRRPFACHGCGGPHPWTEFRNGEHIVVCPNQNNPGIRDNAKRNIERMKMNRQKRHRQNTKRKNLGTANYSDFDAAGPDRIREQVLVSLKNGNCEVSDTTSVASSVTTPSSIVLTNRQGGPGGRVANGSRIFIADVPVLAAGPSLKPLMPIAIHSNLLHIVMQFGTTLDCPHSPSVCCAVNSCAALSTGGTSTTLRLWRNAFRIVSQKCSLHRITRQSSCQALFSPISTKLLPPSWRWDFSFTYPTRQLQGRKLRF